MTIVKQVLLALTLILLASTLALAADATYIAQLRGKNELPRVKTPATGKLTLSVSNNVLTYVLEVTGIRSPTAANIHRGGKGANGPPIAGLFGGEPKRGPFSGILSQGTVSERSLIGELQGKSVADLLRLIESGDAYVNILTETYPTGEIRGVIKRKK